MGEESLITIPVVEFQTKHTQKKQIKEILWLLVFLLKHFPVCYITFFVVLALQIHNELLNVYSVNKTLLLR